MKHTLSISFVLFLAACGTIFLPATTDVSITSSPIEARVSINGLDYGLTPLTVDLSNSTTHGIQISKDGYETVSCILTARIKGSILVLDIVGGLLPVVVDAATGRWKALDETSCSVTLPKVED